MADHDTHDHTGVPGVTPTEVTAIPTSETDTTKRLRPDGAGATEWVAASGSGGDAADIGFDPTGLDNTTATDVQAALEDFDAAISAGGGGGGSDLVQVASGAGSIRLPGLDVADRVPASPNANDDEFDTTSTFTTVLGSLDKNNVTDAKSHLHLRKASTGAFQIHGVYKAIPSMPFTVTMKITDVSFFTTYQRLGLMLLETGPGKIMETGVIFHSTGGANLGYGIWASRTSRSSFADISEQRGWGLGPTYVRMVVASSTDVSTYVSKGGLYWRLVGSSINPGFTIAYVGIHLTGQDNSVEVDGYVDWVRFS